MTQSRRPCVRVCGFVSLALDGRISVLFCLGISRLGNRNLGGRGNQSSEFEVFKIRPMEI